MTNPYKTPKSNVEIPVSQGSNKSSFPKIIGIISIIVSVFTLLSILLIFVMPGVLQTQLSAGISLGYIIASKLFSAVTALWAISIGIKLVKYRDSGRKHYNYYTAFVIVTSFFNYINMKFDLLNMPNLQAQMQQVGTELLIVLFAAPLIILIVALLLNRKSVKASLS